MFLTNACGYYCRTPLKRQNASLCRSRGVPARVQRGVCVAVGFRRSSPALAAGHAAKAETAPQAARSKNRRRQFRCRRTGPSHSGNATLGAWPGPQPERRRRAARKPQWLPVRCDATPVGVYAAPGAPEIPAIPTYGLHRVGRAFRIPRRLRFPARCPLKSSHGNYLAGRHRGRGHNAMYSAPQACDAMCRCIILGKPNI